MSEKLRFLIIGDIIGEPGQVMFQKWAPKLKEKYKINAIIVNGENAAKNGRGLHSKTVDFFRNNGASVVTTGNHVWAQRDFFNALNERNDVIRPANYPPGCPGKGYTFFELNGHTVAVINLMGRVFTHDMLDCPFRTVESLLTFIRTRTNLIFVDFHAEATSEKRVMGLHLDGKVSAVFGTHTHIQTADEHVMPGGTGYVTDLGGCGALYSAIGVEFGPVMERFMLHPNKSKFKVELRGPIVLSGMWVEVDTQTGKTTTIERIRIVDDEVGYLLQDDEKKQK